MISIQTYFAFLLLIFTLNAFKIQPNQQHLQLVDSNQSSFQGINWPFTICGQGSWTIQKVLLSANPTRNTNDDIDVFGTAKDSISFKSVTLNVKLNGVPLHSDVIEYTNSYDSGDTVEFKYKNYIPSFAPAGTYGLQFTFTNSEGKNEGCIALSFKM